MQSSRCQQKKQARSYLREWESLILSLLKSENAVRRGIEVPLWYPGRNYLPSMVPS